MSFDARHPQDPPQARAATPMPAAMVMQKVSPVLLARIGETFAVALCGIQGSLTAIGALAESQQALLDTSLQRVGRLEEFGRRIQSTAHVLAGDASMPAERVDLAGAVRQVIDECTGSSSGSSVRILGPSTPCGVDVNAAALLELLSLGVAHALEVGSRVEIEAERTRFDRHTVLTIRAMRPDRAGAGSVEERDDEVHWLLFDELARAIGLAPLRTGDADGLTLTLAFPDADAPVAIVDPSPALPHTASARGRRVMIVEPQERSRILAARLLHDAGMRVDAASSIEQGPRGRTETAPEIFVTGIPIADLRLHALVDELRAAQPRLRIIELVDDENAFDFSVPGSDSPARVGRGDLAQTLVRAVSQELDAAWPG
jgi:hypothetical protein